MLNCGSTPNWAGEATVDYGLFFPARHMQQELRVKTQGDLSREESAINFRVGSAGRGVFLSSRSEERRIPGVC
jgi:hypothetical protein